MKFYKLRHKPTGLFFRPTAYLYKINVSKKGKIYQTKPSIRGYLGASVYLTDGVLTPTVVADWEVVEYNTDG